MDDIVSPYFSYDVQHSATMNNHNASHKRKFLEENSKSNDEEVKATSVIDTLTSNEDFEAGTSGVFDLQTPSLLSSACGHKLQKEFYEKECTALAKALLGQVLVRKINNSTTVRGIIVETESYLGGTDVASHSYNGKRTPRNEPMYMDAGTLYVYSIYGMYFCLNISSKGDGSCVLIRALEPIEGKEEMVIGRSKRISKSRVLKVHELCNGPSKLCQAMNITKDLCNKIDASTSDEIWLEKGQNIPESEIVISKRIGIESAGPEWADKPLRYYVFNNKHVSVRNKKAEANLSLEK